MKKILILAALLLGLCSCNTSKFPNKPNVSAEITLNGLDDKHWTYFSFEEGAIVGQSEYLNEQDDAKWAGRKDWDFAICADKLKTNGGTSGIGMGGVQQNTTDPFVRISTAPASGYIQDTLRIAR